MRQEIKIQEFLLYMPSNLRADYNKIVKGNNLSKIACDIQSKILALALANNLNKKQGSKVNQGQIPNTNSKNDDYARAHYKDYENLKIPAAESICENIPGNQGDIYFTNRLCLLEFIEEKRFILTPKDNNIDLYTGIIFELNAANKFLLRCINLYDQIVNAGYTSGKVMLYAKVGDDNVKFRSIDDNALNKESIKEKLARPTEGIDINLSKVTAQVELSNKPDSRPNIIDDNDLTKERIKEKLASSTDDKDINLSKVTAQVELSNKPDSRPNISKSTHSKTHRKKIILFSLLSSFSFVAYATKTEISDFVSSKGWGDKQDLINNVALALLILGSLIALSLMIYAGKQYLHHSTNIVPETADQLATHAHASDSNIQRANLAPCA